MWWFGGGSRSGAAVGAWPLWAPLSAVGARPRFTKPTADGSGGRHQLRLRWSTPPRNAAAALCVESRRLGRSCGAAGRNEHPAARGSWADLVPRSALIESVVKL